MTKRTNGQGSVYPIANVECAHCTEGSADDRRHVGGWQAKYIVRGRAVRRNAANRTEALRALDLVKVERETGSLITGKSPTIAAYLRTWIDERDPLLPNAGVPKLAYHTIGGYRRRAAHLCSTIGGVQLRKLEPADVRRGLAAVSARGLSDTTVSDCRVFLATVLKSAMRERPPKVNFNAAELVDHIARPKIEQYAMDEEEASRFLAAARAHPRFYAAMVVGLHSFPRAGELWAAKWDAVDWKARTLHISESLYWIGAGEDRARAAATKGPKTERGDRVVELSALALEALREHRSSQAALLGAVPHRKGYIWTDSAAGAIDHRNVLRDVFYPICAKAGIPYVGRHECFDEADHKGCEFLTFHGLRHTGISLAIAETKDILAVSRMAGHASVEFTMDVYGHLLKKQQTAVSEYMDRAVHG
jgi:integrase